jgi:trimethylamine--corrinoid protein Co-methyltransferase
MQFQADILSEKDQCRIHQQSLRILSEVGVRFYSEAALQVLEANGAQVSRENQIAKIPAELVERALQTAPRSFVLQARNPRFNFPLPSPFTGYVMDGTGAFAVDFETGEKRYGTRQDIENAMRIFQQLDMAVMAWAPTCASDAPSNSRALHEFFAMLKHCSKHGQHELHRVAQVPFFIAGLKVMLGSEEAIRANKICSLIYCPVAPLVHDGEMCSAYLELGQYDIPITVMPMPVAGTTGPASLFSNICLANAETLSALVVFQLANPGRPMIYANAIGALDFSSGAFLSATPEVALQAAALVAMGRFYNLPTTSTGCSSDAKQPGPEAVIEKVISSISPVLAGADLVVGIGEIESDQTLVLEQMVVDNEIAHLCRRLREGVSTGEEQDLFQDIAQVGPGGHFLKRPSTRKAARSGEFYVPGLIDRRTYEAWVNLGKPSMYSKARERVREILASPAADLLPDGIVQELDEILLAADREIEEH